MYAARASLRPTSLHLPAARSPRNQHSAITSRSFISSAVGRLQDEFLDLAIALPLPEYLPPYSTTIILVTVATRLAFTLPFSVWAKHRQWTAEHVVAPQLQQDMPRLRQAAIEEMKRDGYRGESDDAIRKEIAKRMRAMVKVRRQELNKQHGCTSLPTVLVPPLTQLPLFVGTSMVFSRIAQPPSVLDSESFFTLTSLAHSDPTVTLPIILGLVTLANVESSRWFLSTSALEREKQVDKWTADRRAKGEIVLEPRRIVQTGLRALSIARILIAAVVPGSVQLYWVTSATFGLFQTWILDWWYAGKRLPSLPPPVQTSPRPNESARRRI